MDRSADEKSWLVVKPGASMGVKPETFTHEEVYIIRDLCRIHDDCECTSPG
jgi:hypothetical protein